MSAFEITAKESTTNSSATILYDCGDTVNEMVEKFGEDKVFELAKGQLKIAAQTQMRKALKAGFDAARIQAEFDTWTPNSTIEVETSGFSTNKIAARAAGSMSLDEIKDLMAKLKEIETAKIAAEEGSAAPATPAVDPRRQPVA